MAGITQKELIKGTKLTVWQERHNMLLGYENGIRKDLATIQESFVWIGIKLCDIEDQRLYDTVCNSYGEYCKNIFEYALQELDCGRSTVYNLMAVARTFAKPSCGLLSEYKDYSYSQLVELLSFTEEERKYADPHLSVRDLRWLKRGELVCWNDDGQLRYCKLPDRQKQIETPEITVTPLKELAEEEPENRPDVWTEMDQDKFDKEFDDCMRSLDSIIDGSAAKKVVEQLKQEENVKEEYEGLVFNDQAEFSKWYQKNYEHVYPIKVIYKKQ